MCWRQPRVLQIEQIFSVIQWIPEVTWVWRLFLCVNTTGINLCKLALQTNDSLNLELQKHLWLCVPAVGEYFSEYKLRNQVICVPGHPNSIQVYPHSKIFMALFTSRSKVFPLSWWLVFSKSCNWLNWLICFLYRLAESLLNLNFRLLMD